jgi:hypothetical protein
MASVSLEERVANVEAELAILKTKVEAANSAKPQWKKIVGVFADDPAFTEAMRLGREYRESLRRVTRKHRKR